MFKAATDLFGRLSPSKRKKARRDLSDDMFSDDEKETEEGAATSTSFSAGDKNFLMEMTKVMAAHTQNTVKPIIESVEELRKENAALKQEMIALKAGATPADVDKVAQIVIDKLTIAPPPGLQVHNQARSDAGSQPSTSTQGGDPLCWVLGGLGRDLRREDAEEKAREILQAAGTPQTQILDIYAPFAFGSIAHVVVDSTSTALRTQRAVKNLKRDMGQKNAEGQAVFVWFDRKKSKEERLPYLTMLAMFKIVKQDLTGEHVTATGYIKCGASRHVFYETRSQVAFSLNRSNEVMWGKWAQDTFEQEKLQAAMSRLRATLQ